MPSEITNTNGRDEVDCTLCGWMVAASDAEALQDELADHYDERHTG